MENEEPDSELEVEIEQPRSGEAEREARLTPVEAIARMRINVPVRKNEKLRRLIGRVNRDDQIKGWWHVANVNAVARMQINDHSWVHIQIVTNIALKLLRQLTKSGIEPAMVTDYGMTEADAEVVVALTSLTHCIGMSVHRHGHEDFSLFLAEPKLRQLLEGIYEEPERTVIVSEVLQGIISHRSDGEPLTLEAGILRVADALDMEQGRSRIPFERGQVGIHSLSAAAIEDVSIGDGDTKPIRIDITMNNSSGIYQIDSLLGRSCAAPASSPTSRSSPTSTPRPRRASCRCTASRSKSWYSPPLHLKSPFAGSSNGRTPDSESGSLGSSPSPAASQISLLKPLSCCLSRQTWFRQARSTNL